MESLALSEAVCAVCAAVADVAAAVAEFDAAVALAAAFVIVDFISSISPCNCSVCVAFGSIGDIGGVSADNTFIVVEVDIMIRSVTSPYISMPRIVTDISPANSKGSAGMGTTYAPSTSKSVVSTV